MRLAAWWLLIITSALIAQTKPQSVPCEPDLVTQFESYQDGMRAQEKHDRELITAVEWERDVLRSKLSNQITQAGTVGFGIGIGVVSMWAVILFWKRRKPSTAKKQLTTMLLAAAWIVIAGIALSSTLDPPRHPIGFLVAFFVYSLPALLFGGITVWWLSRKTQLP